MTTAPLPRARRAAATATLALTTTLLAACAGTADGAPAGATPTAQATTPAAQERATAVPRLAVSYDGGVQVLDATTLEVVADLPLDGYLRLNPAGDGRHVVVSTAEGFRLLDAGTWSDEHGDHAHHFTVDPLLTDVTYPAVTPGHVVVHDGRTVLFDDGTGTVTALDAGDVAHGPDDAAGARTHTTPHAHHGVAVELHDGTLVVSDGTEDARTGARALDADGREIAASDECPGVHGESVAADDVVAIGCENGVLLYRDGTFTHVTSPDPYGRIGNQAGSDASPVVLGDYKSDPDADLERPTRVSLVDTRTATLRLVDLPASYTFRPLARGDAGEALVLGTDGALHVIDPETGALVRSVPVVAPWEEPAEWQTPRPAVRVHDGTAYVTEPATRSIHAVDVLTGEVYRSARLDVVPDELTVAPGGTAPTHSH
ncbi:pyrrolo-quinoline quinone [Cellulomonas flavigena DSM 20109]|uniref:Pyrrolo-quinoline quinone n=1 Tax=Cellulomonas flavigena (strain ATCC 482 / DSM 20109 / BCRC 11376 / JCM 18109 / NBRC 3775 / NCIMB 8073 / NRS 134) TaxID=446466 RepID=D5UG88_CELFN|nr:zinc metallochaperone AztD [Cellulomonas flavigena]ADG73071.1 pyrrolo-quinoline quinone [Cellulomonas flavigena DSM 20109]